MPTLTPEQIEANERLGLHPQFCQTAIELPQVITPEFLDTEFPAWRRARVVISRMVVTQQKPGAVSS